VRGDKVQVWGHHHQHRRCQHRSQSLSAAGAGTRVVSATPFHLIYTEENHTVAAFAPRFHPAPLLPPGSPCFLPAPLRPDRSQRRMLRRWRTARRPVPHRALCPRLQADTGCLLPLPGCHNPSPSTIPNPGSPFPKHPCLPPAPGGILFPTHHSTNNHNIEDQARLPLRYPPVLPLPSFPRSLGLQKLGGIAKEAA